jgi:antitoxin HigA-1
MQPIKLTQAALAEAMGVQRKHVNELCNNRRNVTAATALILARVFGNSPDFWLNVQRRSDLWEAMNSLGNASGSSVRSRWSPPRDLGSRSLIVDLSERPLSSRAPTAPRTRRTAGSRA